MTIRKLWKLYQAQYYAFEELCQLLNRSTTFKFKNKIDFLWYPWDCNKCAHEVEKWIVQIILHGSDYLSKISPNIEHIVIYNSFTSLKG